MSEQDLVVHRWRRFGKDRLYVESSDGVEIGFWDLLTDTGHPAKPEDEPGLTASIKRWKSETAQQEAATTMTPSTEASAPPSPETTARHASDREHGDEGHGAERTEVLAPVLAEQSDHPNRTSGSDVHQLASVAPAPDTGLGEVVRPWVDLATNQPGAEAREQARSAREAAPVRTVLARVLGVHTDERAWRIGANGEERVAAQLAKVAKKNPRWRFLHAIPVGHRGSDIDHLVIGPGGVFTINTKHHPGAKIWVGGNTLMVNGNRQPYVRNARHEAERAAKLLTATCGFPVVVGGLIVTVNARDVVVKNQPQGVHVTRGNNIVTWLLRHGDILSDQTIDAIYEVARRSTTWTP